MKGNSVTGAYFYKVTPESIEHYFRELAQRSPIDIILYNIPQFSNEIPVEVVRRLALDCPRIAGVKDSSRDMPRFLNMIDQIKPQRPDFSLLVGCEEILFPVLIRGHCRRSDKNGSMDPSSIQTLVNDIVNQLQRR